MQNIRYHIINTGSVILFSFLAAVTINQFIKLSLTPAFSTISEKNKFSNSTMTRKKYEDYKVILDSSFFKIASESDSNPNPDNSLAESGNLSELQLLGTISGPSSIARALLRKKGEKDSKIFKLWNDVYGYKLVRIDNSRIYLQKDKTIDTLDLYAKDDKGGITKNDKPVGKNKQSISRSEVQQKLMNNVDNALEGLRAGPNKVNGKIDGYKLFRVSPDNFLYKLGARSGDIAKRINGHPIDSTEKLMGLWQTIQGESKISVDLERDGKIQTFEINITN